MGLSAWIELITAFLKAPDSILKLVRAFQGTPEEHREALVSSVQAQADAFAKSGRPSWG